MMDAGTNWSFIIVARQESFRVWGRFDHGHTSFGATEMMLIAGAVAIVLAAMLLSYAIARRRRRDFWLNSQPRLFQELCRAHRLDLANRRLLKQLAAAHRMESPALLFVEPEYFDGTNLPPGLKSSAQELRQLRHALFD